MDPVTIITRKRNGEKLSREEIDYFIAGYCRDRIPDYQAAALLMAIFLRGMDFEETAALTFSMLESGIRLNLRGIAAPKIDKHSTGGVGDKVSLILAPLMAAAGLCVPMISGRGLGHTGGTLDKLEAIPGFRTQLSLDEFHQQLETVGTAIIGQSEQIVPADRKLYALRDATATIESMPLITASILSKKLAEDLDGLVLDIKTGRGAFMRTFEEARTLSEMLIKTASLNRMRTRVLITRMDEPLGRAVGSWLEVKETIECLQGKGPKDLMEVTLALGAEMLMLAYRCADKEEAHALQMRLIECGAAWEWFCRMVEAQGGNVDYLSIPDKYPSSRITEVIKADRSGYVSGINALGIGRAVVKLGGGRYVMEDQIDHKAGVLLHVQIGSRVKAGQPLATLFSDRMRAVEEAAALAASAFSIDDAPAQKKPLILDTLGEESWRE